MKNVTPLRASRRESSSTGAPKPWRRISDRYPAVVEAYDSLREACNAAGPLDASTIALLKLGVSIGAGANRTVHMHAKKALRAGAAPEALRQIALVALPTIGLPAALDALRWVDESIQEVLADEKSQRAAR
jgi:alkylhydroperoxidase/carboxymuconolactone decarboxylase family protein YurZ